MSPDYKISFHIPRDRLQPVLDAIDTVRDASDVRYGRAYSFSEVTDTWRPLEGSEPHSGTVGVTFKSVEVKVELAVDGDILKAVLRAISENHPYEEPIIDVYPLMDWRAVLDC